MKYYLKRTAQIPVTIFAVATLTFGLIRLLPGGPFTQLRIELLQRGIPVEQVDARIETLQNVRPDDPLWQQYIDYMVGLAQLDFGQSISQQEPVLDVLVRALPWTVFLVVTSTILMFIIGVLIGAVQAYWEGSRFDRITSGGSIFLMSIPYYIFAVIFLYVLAFQYQLFPTGNAVARGADGALSLSYFVSVLNHAALPIAAFTIGGIGSTALNMRGNGIQVLGEEFVEVARLRGLSNNRIATRYVARNAILPMYTGLLLMIGFRLGGTVVLEEIFSYPGLGYYMIDAVNANDYPLMMGCFLVITTTLVIGVYIADMTYGLIDPRISAGESNEY